MTTSIVWAVYYLASVPASGRDPERPQGYVWNRILWDGITEWSPPDGSSVVSDPDGKYPIGSIYTPSSP